VNDRAYPSMCECGHRQVQHVPTSGGIVTHGGCAVCGCGKFTWVGFDRNLASVEHLERTLREVSLR
jgi:hypothetical protein